MHSEQMIRGFGRLRRFVSSRAPRISRTRARVAAAIAVACVLAAVRALAANPDVVLYASDVTTIRGNWSETQSAGDAGGVKMQSVDRGWSTVNAPLPAPTDYIEATF